MLDRADTGLQKRGAVGITLQSGLIPVGGHDTKSTMPLARIRNTSPALST